MTSEIEAEAQTAAVAACFPEPGVDDQAIRRGQGMKEFLARSMMDHAVELRRFMNGNLRVLPAHIAQPLCRALHGEYFRPSLFELVVARTVQLLGARDLEYELASQSGSRPDLRPTFDDGSVVIDATVPEFDAEIAKDQAAYRPLIEIVEDLAPDGWSFFVEDLPRIGPSESQREFKKTISAEFAKLAELPPPDPSDSPITPTSRELRADHTQGEIRLRLGGRSSGERAFAGGPISTAYGDTDARVAKALRRKRAQLRGGDAPALIAIAGGMGESVEDFGMTLFGRTFARMDEHRRIVETGFNPTGIWGRLQGGDSVLAGLLVFCRWQWTIGQDPVLYVNPRFGGTLPRAFGELERRELRGGAVVTTPATSIGLFARLREAAGLSP